MTFSFIEGIPYTLANEIRLEYERLLNDLRFIVEIKKNLAKWVKENYELITFLLELSIFYRRIIMPLRGTAEFGLELPHSLIVGSDTLNKEELENIKSLVSKFENIISKYGITPGLLDFGDVEEFLYKLKKFEQDSNEYADLEEPI